MRPVNFPESNDTIDGVPTLSETRVIETVQHQWSITCWRLSIRERLLLLFTGRVWAVRTDSTTELSIEKTDVI